MTYCTSCGIPLNPNAPASTSSGTCTCCRARLGPGYQYHAEVIAHAEPKRTQGTCITCGCRTFSLGLWPTPPVYCPSCW